MLNVRDPSVRMILATVCMVLLGSGGLKAQTPATGENPTAVVEMRSISFFPKSVTVAEGQSVVWKNVSYTDHSATSDDDGKTFDTNMITPKASTKAMKFAHAGRFHYHCKMHGRTMSAEVIVTPKS